MFNSPRKVLPAVGLVFAVAFATSHTSPAVAQGWKAEWNKTVAGAKKEGKLVVYMRRYQKIFTYFKKKYPSISIATVSGRGSQLGTRILSEQRAGKFLVDVYIGGPYTVTSMLIPGKTLDPISKALILPEVKDGSGWISGKVRYSDPEHKYNIGFLASPGSNQIAYNTKMVKATDINSYKALLDPKWSGKIVSLDPTQRFIGGTTTFMYYNPNLGPDYVKAFFDRKGLTIAKNNRQMTDWLAEGKFALCLGCLYVQKAHDQGLPVAIFDTSGWKEGVGYLAGSGTISLIKNAPHPNAARLFVNWLLSREGQIAMQKISDRGIHYNSARIDIPKDDVSPDYRLTPGRKYFDQNDPRWTNFKPVLRLARKIMADREKH